MVHEGNVQSQDFTWGPVNNRFGRQPVSGERARHCRRRHSPTANGGSHQVGAADAAYAISFALEHDTRKNEKGIRRAMPGPFGAVLDRWRRLGAMSVGFKSPVRSALLGW
jgi:hypothetical protein